MGANATAAATPSPSARSHRRCHPEALAGAVTTPSAHAASRLADRPDRFGQWVEPAGRSLGGCPGIVCGRPPPLWAVAPGRTEPSTVPGFLKPFLFVLNSRKQFKLPKFLETFRNVQKWQTKFCWTPIEQLYTVGLTKLTLVLYFIVHNYKNSNIKLFVYKYLYLIML
jgi:hypothetical protein